MKKTQSRNSRARHLLQGLGNEIELNSLKKYIVLGITENLYSARIYRPAFSFSYSVIENERFGLVFAKTVSCPNLQTRVFVKTSPKHSHAVMENEHFGLVFVKTGSIISGTVPEIIDPVFAKTSQYARFLLSENKRFGLVFVKTWSINSGTGLLT